jgi:hypothetical protein
MGTLTSNRKPSPVPQSPIRPDLHEPFNIHGNRFPQVPFDHSIPLDDIPNAHGFVFGQIFYLSRSIKLGFLTNLESPAMPDPIDIGQTDPNFLIQRQIHSCDSSQFLPPWKPRRLVSLDAAYAWGLYNEPEPPVYGALSCILRTFF